jgi:Mg2+-importing ATPase
VPAPRWLAWLVGGAVLAALVLVVLHGTEQRALVRLVAAAEPRWLVWAALLQAGTYLAQAGVWLTAVRAAGHPVSVGTAYRLSIAKLFVDQALPSAGVSGTVVMAKALEARQVPHEVVMASVVISTASYYGAYAVSILAALAIVASRGRADALVMLAALLFVAGALAVVAAVLRFSGPGEGALGARLRRVPVVRTLLDAIAQAEPHLAHRPRLLARATTFQLVIVLLDAATLWVLVRSLGTSASFAGVFGSFVLSSMVRTLSIVPGGLGAFEAAAVLTLALGGVPALTGLSATLLFRGFSFWLPMLPGLLLSRRIVARDVRVRAAPAGAAYWTVEPAEIARRLDTTLDGLASATAARRLADVGPNELRAQRRLSRASVLWDQLRNPLLFLLVFAAGVAALTGDWVDAVIVLTILLASVGIGYSREYRAQSAALALQARVRIRATVLREGQPVAVPLREVVPGDVVMLSAGSLVPADAVLVAATDCFVNEAVLTGESFPVEKRPGVVDATAGLGARTNCVFLGTNVRGGTARCLVVATGPRTEFGRIAHRLALRPPETEFDRGMRRFGYLLTSIMSAMVIIVFAVNVMFGRGPVETLLFSIALAVGLSPELMPIILNVNLARGAQAMARHGVLVKRLAAIENLGSMDVLCTDKTGTLTEGVVGLDGAYDGEGASSGAVLELAAWNAALQTGLATPLDAAILQARRPDPTHVEKVTEIPYDFVRKRVSVVVRERGVLRLIVKGAFEPLLAACTTVGGRALDDAGRRALHDRFLAWSRRGIRVLAVAERALAPQPSYGRDDERALSFAGFLTFLDRPKEGVDTALAELGRLGVSVKLISGDTRLVAQHVAASVGMRAERIVTGAELDRLRDEALWRIAEMTDLFVEVDPRQKERIILALKNTGHVVGFLGDGVNDAPAMHAADTGLSVESAVDVAREAADFVLLERDLDVIRRGIEEGRKTFANTLKYVLITTSANLGNMVSMALASLVLPFLPLTAVQILLNNLLSDIPAIGLADDAVDAELVDRPRRWDMRFIGRFMVEFGVLSSVFDFLTFGALLGLFAAGPMLFQTGWFVQSLLTELVVALIVRTQRPCYQSRPGALLFTLSVVMVGVTLALPYLPFVEWLGFMALPASVLGTLAGITALYALATELAKRRFYRRGT